MSESYHLTFLSLADNNSQKTLLDNAATALGNMVATNYFLTDLDLRWNHIQGYGAGQPFFKFCFAWSCANDADMLHQCPRR